ncbi:ent-kaur-16-ene synthase chloroplastic-like [Prunus yedoensis var. nudiflora]|uniref:Ent-kaur-16-ene synthase chloroplastic-like n=1 Tax=Prunus yedoensis var. nudiflora TaxID=2094558 RepID=A0A314Z7R4_PRUYE|nr:ent-kaur-16-ene synthase chloroplastic-like [Prunus yedoensis var. nudiflora]
MFCAENSWTYKIRQAREHKYVRFRNISSDDPQRDSAQGKLNAVSLMMIRGNGVITEEEEAINEIKSIIKSKRRELLFCRRRVAEFQGLARIWFGI